MRDHLILKLEGVLQSWGEHTFEGLRPSEQFPTRSGIIGLLAACIGIDRRDKDLQQALGDSIQYAARKDQKTWPMVRMTDYHTVKNARKEYSGLKAHDTIVTQREYLQDATFTIALWSTDNAAFSLDQIQEATCKPRYTPFLGRRCCPISRPLYEERVAAKNADLALEMVEPFGGVVFSEEPSSKAEDQRYLVRDVPLHHQPRQFASRRVYYYSREVSHAPE